MTYDTLTARAEAAIAGAGFSFFTGMDLCRLCGRETAHHTPDCLVAITGELLTTLRAEKARLTGDAAMTPVEERTAQLLAHRACHSAEHDPLNGKIHGWCVVCGVPWPCVYAGTPQSAPQAKLAARHEAEQALRYMRMSREELIAALRAAEQERDDALKQVARLQQECEQWSAASHRRMDAN